MNLIYYIYTIFPNLWRDPHLFSQVPDVINRIIGCRIQFMNIKSPGFVKGSARFTGIAGFGIITYTGAVYGLGKNPGTGGFAYSPGTAKQVGMAQVIMLYGILQCIGDRRLSNYRSKCFGSVFPCRYNEIIHADKISNYLLSNQGEFILYISIKFLFLCAHY